MPRIENSIVVEASLGKTYQVVNDIGRWPELFEEYSSASVDDRIDAGRFSLLTFTLGSDKASWTSKRIMDHEDCVVYAERLEPMFPFQFMHLKWTFTETAEGTRMVWTQDFELADGAPMSTQDALDHMNSHTRVNQQRIKNILERTDV